jgi:hypothetical protein
VCRPSAMCAMPSGTQMSTLTSGSTRATHPGTARWSKLQQGGESEGGRGGRWCEPSLPSWTLAVSNKDSHAATERPGPILDSLESCRLGFRSSPAAVTFGESTCCQHGEGDTQARRSTHAGQGSTLQVQQPRGTRARGAESHGQGSASGPARCVCGANTVVHSSIHCSLHKRSSAHRKDTSRRRILQS